MGRIHFKGRNTLSTTRKRVLFISVGFLVFTSYLITNLFKLQITGFDYYKNKVYDQITTTSTLRANRGTIYDTNMTPLATSSTEWRVFISTRDIKKAEKEFSVNFSDIIAGGLAEIFNISKKELLNKIKNRDVGESA